MQESLGKVYSRQSTTGRFKSKEAADDLPQPNIRGRFWQSDRDEDEYDGDEAFTDPSEEAEDEEDEDDDALASLEEAADRHTADDAMRRQIHKRRKMDDVIDPRRKKSSCKCYEKHEEAGKSIRSRLAAAAVAVRKAGHRIAGPDIPCFHCGNSVSRQTIFEKHACDHCSQL
ncbi:MAG TPA: hypothetical protein VKB88_31590 [Bryobacteraceae bacterium]|nr:hypothetical protein [Bryobacteraceae bacterium]